MTLKERMTFDIPIEIIDDVETKAGFDPNQDRADDGKWTATGGGGGASSDGKPEWWDEPTGNRLDRRGFTEGEAIMDWLERHKVEVDADGKYIFYHGTPTGDVKPGESIRKGSLLETVPEEAAKFSAHNRELDPEKDITVFKVKVDPWQIYTGHWASIREDIQVDEVWKPEATDTIEVEEGKTHTEGWATVESVKRIEGKLHDALSEQQTFQKPSLRLSDDPPPGPWGDFEGATEEFEEVDRYSDEQIKEFRGSVGAPLRRMSQSSIDAIERGLDEIHFRAQNPEHGNKIGSVMIDRVPGLRKAPDDYKMQLIMNAGGGYNAVDKQLFLSTAKSETIAAHEFAHIIDFNSHSTSEPFLAANNKGRFGGHGVNPKLTNTKEWLLIYKREYSNDASGAATAYGKTRPTEGFCEAAALMLGDEKKRAKLKKNLPRTYNFFIDKGVVSRDTPRAEVGEYWPEMSDLEYGDLKFALWRSGL